MKVNSIGVSYTRNYQARNAKKASNSQVPNVSVPSFKGSGAIAGAIIGSVLGSVFLGPIGGPLFWGLVGAGIGDFNDSIKKHP